MTQTISLTGLRNLVLRLRTCEMAEMTNNMLQSSNVKASSVMTASCKCKACRTVRLCSNGKSNDACNAPDKYNEKVDEVMYWFTLLTDRASATTRWIGRPG